jgi:hypothetical protein
MGRVEDEMLELLESQFKKAAPGSQEQARITENIERLLESKRREEKQGADFEEMSLRMDSLESEAEEKKKGALWSNILHTIEVVGGIVGGIFWFLFNNQAFHETLDFEKEGTPSSNSFRTIYRNISEFRNRRGKKK